MAEEARNIKRQASFKKVTEIISKNKTALGKTTLGVFVLLGLLALASPVALPAEIAALGIGAVGIFLDKVTDEKLSEEDIVREVQKIINENGLLKKTEFTDYMAPIYPKLLEISEKLDSFPTSADLQTAIGQVLPSLQEISQKIDRLATKSDLSRAVSELKDVKSFQTNEEKLKEGWEKLKSIPLQTIPNPTTFTQGSKNFKFSSNPNFIGRNSQLMSLAKLFKGESPEEVGNCVAVTGMGGVGKTQLLVEFVQRYGQYFAGGIYWIDFSQPELISSQIADCSKMSMDQPFEERLAQVRSEWVDEFPRLLIFDNCENLELLSQWIPPTGGRRVLVSSRHKNLGQEMGVIPLPLDPLTRKSSLTLLHHYRKYTVSDKKYLGKIAEELGDLPLALHLAGSYLQKYRFEVTPEKYLADLKQVKPLQHPSMKSGKFSPTDHDLNVERTFLISYQKLRRNQEDQIALQILLRAACFAPGAWIPRGLLQASLGEEAANEQFADSLNRLLSLGLIEENEIGDVWVHRLVCSFVRDLDKDQEPLHEVELLVNHVAGVVNVQGFPGKMQTLLMHLQFLTDQALPRRDEIAANLANNFGYYFYSIGQYKEAQPYFDQALAINRKVLGEEHPDTANILDNLGGLFDSMGQYKDARLYYEQALAIRRKVLGEQHPDTARSLNNLGYLFQVIGQYEAAQPCFLQALATNQKILGEEHPITAKSLNNLGALFESMGQYKEARPFFERALAIHRKLLGDEHPDTAICLNNLGHLLQCMGQYEVAQPYFEQALTINRKVLGEERPVTASSQNNLGYLLQVMGKYEAALPYIEQALATRRKVFGEEHPDTAGSLNNLGLLYDAMGQHEKARPYYEQALGIFKKTLGVNHPSTKIVQENLDSLLKEIANLPSKNDKTT